MDAAMKWIKLVLLGSAALLALALTFFVLQARESLIAAESSASELAVKANKTIDTVNATLEHINRPCKGVAGPDACGTLAQVNKTVIGIGDLVVTTQKQTTLVATMVGQYGTVLQGVAGDIHSTTGALTGTANAATGTLNATTATVGAAKPLLDNSAAFVANLDTETKPVVTQANLFFTNVNALATRPSIPIILDQTAGILTTGNHMLLTGDQVETKLAQCTLHPHVSCYLKSDILFGAQVGGYLLPH
jgi:hypothetical protein